MGLYDTAWPHVYDEIIRFYPVWYRDVLEMDAIWRAEGYELHHIRNAIEQIVLNSYIHTADAETIGKYEKFLGLPFVSGMTLEDRRARVAAIMYPSPHIGAPEIRDIVGIFTTGKIDVGFSKGFITITVSGAADESFSLADCGFVLQRRIPAHLALRIVEVISAKEPVTLHIGGGVGAAVRVGTPEEADELGCSAAVLHAGGQTAVQTTFPVPVDTAPPPSTTILRSGGVCTIISNLSKGE